MKYRGTFAPDVLSASATARNGRAKTHKPSPRDTMTRRDIQRGVKLI
jgi:hypothetical protein